MMPAVKFDDLIHLLDDNVTINKIGKFDNYDINFFLFQVVDHHSFSIRAGMPMFISTDTSRCWV